MDVSFTLFHFALSDSTGTMAQVGNTEGIEVCVNSRDIGGWSIFDAKAPPVYISARPTSHNTGNNKNISVGCNEGKVGTENEYDVKGDIGENVSLSNISNIHVSGTNRGCIGGRNSYTVKGRVAAKTNIGNVSNVTVGNNSGSIGSGNRINIS